MKPLGAYLMESKTKWDDIISGEELAKIKKLRAKPFIESKERRSALKELIQEGWTESKQYKDKRFVGVRKSKKFDEIFEDKVWTLFARLGFTYMNKDRYFAMSYDPNNPKATQQIDVFAADDETVLIIECKSSETNKMVPFKKAIEALHGQMDGFRKEARKRFPKAKIKFIWASENCIISNADQEKSNEWGIVYFNDSVIKYYDELVRHLGTCARYQLLGNLFASQEIRNMEDKIPAIQGEMGGHKYYAFSIEPERLLKIGYVLHRNEANKNMMPTYQRIIKKKRLAAVRSFIDNGGYFPNSLIISIDTQGKKLQFDLAAAKVDDALSKLGILHLPKRYRSAYIIDGQHRLYGYSDSRYAKTNCIPVVAFENLDRKEQIKLFMEINENQKAVPKTLRVTLNADMLWDSDDFNERQQALRSKIAQMLGEEATSPLGGQVLIGEEEKTPTKCITVEAIQNALKKCNFLTQYDKKNTIIKDGTFDIGNSQKTCDLLYGFLEDCLLYVRKSTTEEWEQGEAKDGILTINRGIQAVIRVISDIVDMCIANQGIDPKNGQTKELLRQVEFYLDPLNDYINKISQEERKALKKIFGGGADNLFLRTFQRAIAKTRNDFQPEGLKEYWENQAKIYNTDSLKYLIDVSALVKDKIGSILMDKYGKNWEVKGIPKPIFIRANGEASAKNYDNTQTDYNGGTITPWDCVSLKECKEIVTSGSQWTELFADVLTRKEDTGLSSKDKKTEWIVRLETIRNKLLQPSYSVTKEEFTFIKSVYDWSRSW